MMSFEQIKKTSQAAWLLPLSGQFGQDIIPEPHRCEGNMAVTFVTLLIARVDLAEFAHEADFPFLPQCPTCIPLEPAGSVELDYPRQKECTSLQWGGG